MKTLRVFLLFLLVVGTGSGETIVKHFRIEKQYLNFPIAMNEDRQPVTFMDGADTLTSAVMRIADGDPEYWVFKDVSAWKGKTVTLTFSRNVKGIGMVHQSDTFEGQDSLYRETNRPQFHFSSRRGWNNDPNGLVWFDGEYHLFYQHNPYETQWENMHWGHAVSPDLLHWKELPDALEPDRMGTMFSGSAVVDHDNTGGWGRDAIVAAYTADKSGHEVQCIAYSTDRGRTFRKFEGNPVAGKDRDPRVFRHQPSGRWVMALYKDAGISILTSTNLRTWQEESHVPGFYECPDLFELPVDGDRGKSCWVLMGASGTYMLGTFDGKVFVPRHGKYRTFYGAQYAAQTFNGTPDGKRIQIMWGRIEHPGMPFNQMMLMPTELTLRMTAEGVRLFSEPIAGMRALHGKKHELTGISVEQVNDRLKEITHHCVRVVARLESVNGGQIVLEFRGNRIVVLDADEINGIQVPLKDPGKLIFDVELLIDRTSLEAFYQHGQAVIAEALKPAKDGSGLKITGDAANIRIHALEVYEMNSIWTSR